jgi:peptide-methionine (S)-S-oxide reductase
MKVLKHLFTAACLVLLVSCFGFSDTTDNTIKATYIPSKTTEIAYFASGCFWCVEAIFENVSGVEEAISGYAGGFTENPTYQSIGTGKTGHSETVAVYYNPKKVSFETLVADFFGSHDPPTKNGQHPDYGSQYR